jgi:hypothetical protein
LALTAGAGNSIAQTWANPKTFDTSKGSWITWNGWGMQDDGTMLTQDPTLDAANDPNSGSLRYAFPFTGAGGEQFMTFGTLHDQWGWDNTTVINCVGNYSDLALDFKLDPATSPNRNGDFGSLELGLVTSDWGQIKVADYPVPASATSWTHLDFPIDQTAAGLEKVTGYYIKMWSGDSFTNMVMFNVDNIYLKPSTNQPPPPPPTLSVAQAQPGLNLIAAGTGPWDRQNIRTVNPAYSWVGKGATPVSYSFTITAFPGTNNPGFELHNYLTPVPYDPVNGAGTIDANASADWNQTNCVFMDLQNQADGSATWVFRWKTNAIPDGNGTYFSDPLASLNDPAGPLGTWTLVFQNNSDVKMIGPSGVTTNFTFSADKLAGYVDAQGAALPLYYYIGIKPNDHPSNFGLSAIASKVKIDGVSTPINADFTKASVLDTNVWELSVNNPGAVQVAPPDALLWVKWTLPDPGFVLQGNSLLSAKGWSDLSGTPLQTSLGKSVLITGSNKPGNSQGYFQMLKRSFTRLLVLLPGETVAPGTTTGKSGKPDAQVAATPFNVTVYAVDDTWHVIPLAPNDEIALTSSDDGSGNVVLPANGNLAAGSRTFSVTVNVVESLTFTGTDVTDSTKTSSTSSALSVTQ